MYIAVDLKVIEGKAGAVARAAGCHEDRVLAGLVRLWHRVWCDSSDHLNMTVLAGLFGGDGLPLVVGALVSFGFLEPVGDEYRARGSARYLRLKESRREGARKTNEARSKSAPKRRSRAKLSDAGATHKDALSPSTEHRAPNTESTALREPSAARRFSDSLCEDFMAETGQRYRFSTADGVQLASLKKLATEEEISRRWRIGLRQVKWKQTATIAQLASKWNDLALPDAPVRDLTRGVAEMTEADLKSHHEVGEIPFD